MRRSRLLIIVFVTIATFSAIYAPQPLLAVLAKALGVDAAHASLITTATLLPLGVAPLFYGLMLESIPAERVLLVAVALMGIASLGLAASGTYTMFMGFRLVQGLCAPAVLTCCMTLAAGGGNTRGISGEELRRSMSIYIAATIFGGFFGRFMAGAVSTLLDWRVAFLGLGATLLAGALLVTRLDVDAAAVYTRVQPRTLWRVLRMPGFLRVYGIVFCVFFVFASLLNFLPFRLQDLGGGFSEIRIGGMYAGYLVGIVVSLLAPRTMFLLGGEVRAVLLGLVVFLLVTPIFAVAGAGLIFAGMFVFCGGMFQVHSTAPGLLQRMAGNHRGVVNGLYLSFYYVGGAVGTSAPAIVYERFGWEAFVMLLTAVLLFALLLAVSLLRFGGMRTGKDASSRP
ncbi:MFS transporter [Oceanidesulfovibrio indonesiensis]|uniref:MFS transporter n=1 Tax=Oceanidesulfovibrio indonesiensis TaxID=54767 RepID=A0A7M3MD13_9BACT|nr:MFS transporter [Oceanidesulfovibrio indonesiensis]TVM16400.1 MFS transporter [Oceanidesulfovibrio indonesiensis]